MKKVLDQLGRIGLSLFLIIAGMPLFILMGVAAVMLIIIDLVEQMLNKEVV